MPVKRDFGFNSFAEINAKLTGLMAPGAHATTHQNGGGDQLTSHATTNENLVWAGPATAPAAGPGMRALVVADLPANITLAKLHPYPKTTYIETCLSGVLPGITAAYAAPGTTVGGLAAPARLMYFTVPGVAPASTWTLYGSFGILGTAPGGADTCIVTILKSSNAGATWANTTNTFTMTGATKDGYDDTHAISFTTGDAIGVRVDGGGSAADLSVTLVITRTA